MAKIAPSLFMALLVCESSKPAREQLHRSEIEPDLTAGDGGLKVFGEAAVAVEPSEGSFDHPTARQDTRAGTIAAVRGGEPAGHPATLAPRLLRMVVSRERNRCEKPAFPSLLAPSGRPFASLLLSLSRSRHRTVSGCFERPYRRRAGADEIFFLELRERRVL